MFGINHLWSLPHTGGEAQTLETPPITTAIDRSEQLLYRVLSRIRHGAISIVDPRGKERVFGDWQTPLRARLHVHHQGFFKRLVHAGSLGLGESYMDEWWDVENDDLVGLFRVAFANRLEFALRGDFTLRAAFLLERLRSSPWWMRVAKRDIHAHYDLGNDLFKGMLDESMAYSCGYQRAEGDSLATMQQQKYERIYNKLRLERGGSLIDIGCGWGGMLIYAAKRNSSLIGTGLTLSAEQQTLATERIKQEGLENRIDVQLLDYREARGAYDFMVSVGMFEHVGRRSYPSFFEHCQKLLKPGGLGLLHTIGLEEDPSYPTDPWINKYIFPGSRLPRLEEIVRELRRRKMVIGHLENLRPHYACTLAKWRSNFKSTWESLSSTSKAYDRTFYRMWNYYLQISEAGFYDSTMELYQVLFSNGREWRFPTTFSF